MKLAYEVVCPISKARTIVAGGMSSGWSRRYSQFVRYSTYHRLVPNDKAPQEERTMIVNMSEEMSIFFMGRLYSDALIGEEWF